MTNDLTSSPHLPGATSGDGHHVDEPRASSVAGPSLNNEERAVRDVRGAVALALASLWLGASLAIGGWLALMDPAADATVSAKEPDLSAQSSHTFYGGDAYTGIQNAVVDTEHAVVDGINDLGSFQEELARSVARHQDRNDEVVRLGLAALIVSIGVVNFNVALGRRRPGPKPAAG